MKKLLLLGIMLLGMGGVNSNISAAPALKLKIGKEFTSVASLEGKSFAIVKDGKLIYNTTNYNLGYGTLSDAISASNNGYLFKIETLASNADADIRDCYLLRGLKGDGTQYNIGGNPPYFQSHPSKNLIAEQLCSIKCPITPIAPFIVNSSPIHSSNFLPTPILLYSSITPRHDITPYISGVDLK